jgi:peptide/nickel transport system permease protein
LPWLWQHHHLRVEFVDGRPLLKALIAQDMFLAGTIILLLGVMTVIGTFISDLLLMWVDPRIRLGRE